MEEQTASNQSANNQPENNQEQWTPHPTDGGTFYGNQIARGGGQFLGKINYDLNEAMRGLTMPAARGMVAGQADAFSEAFAPLRAAAAQNPNVRPLIDVLEQELRKGANPSDASPSDVVGADLVKIIVNLLPPAAGLLRTLLTVSPVKEAIGPVTRAVIERNVP